MPFILSKNTCKKCGESNKLFRNKKHNINKKFYLQTTCKDCEALTTKKHQKENKDYWRKINRQYYAKKGRKFVNPVYYKRVSQARFTDEFTKFVSLEAKDVAKKRETLTGIKWHIDHIIPLKNSKVCGLHIWSNLQVITATENYSKRNKFAGGL